MKVGFDYWQVISHYPNKLGSLATALRDTGHEVVIISATGKGWSGTIVDDVHKQWPTFPADHVYVVVFDHPSQSPELKLAKCKELEIEMFFDDRDDVCRLLAKSGILAMRVSRRDGSIYDLEAERV